MANNIICFFHEYMPYGYLSNFYHTEFSYGDKLFNSSEQFMMYHKVMIFGQKDLAEQIMATDNPKEMKRLGRTKFKSYDDDLWWRISYTIVKRGVRAKFEQNEDILQQLLATGDQILVECAPMDSKWSIGRAVDDPDCDYPQKWNGINYLGRILMEVRDELGRAAKMGTLGYVNAVELQFPLWHMQAGVLRCDPKYHRTIGAYADTLGDLRDEFLYSKSLAEWEQIICNGGILPAVGFWELKQDIFDIHRLS